MLAVLEPSTQINGVVVIMDYNNMGLKQVRGNGFFYLKPIINLKLIILDQVKNY